jgi:hypothetical protein
VGQFSIAVNTRVHAVLCPPAVWELVLAIDFSFLHNQAD